MEAVLILFAIVILFALLSGAGRSSGGAEGRSATRSESAAGRSDQEIRDFLVARYGDFVLFEPPFKASTYVLWLGPFALLGVGLAGILVYFRRRAASPAAARPLSAAEQQRVAELLKGEGGGEGAA